MTKIGWRAFVNSTTLESNQGLVSYQNSGYATGSVRRYGPQRTGVIRRLFVPG